MSHGQILDMISGRPNGTNTKITTNLSNMHQLNSNLQALKLTSESMPTTYVPDFSKISPVLDQKNCGSCWALSSTSVLSDRFMVATGIKNLELNPLIPVSCSTTDLGCDGGQPSNCGTFFENVGCSAKTDECIGWNEFCETSKCLHPPPCQVLKCPTTFKAIKGSTKSLAVLNSDGVPDAKMTITNIMAEIIKNGSVVCSSFVPFAMYDPEYWPETSGILMVGGGFYDNRLKKHFKGQKVDGMMVDDDDFTWDSLVSVGDNPSGHAMAIIGWGNMKVPAVNDKTVLYWVVRNSWGVNWAEKGFFKYAIYNPDLGVNVTCGLDVPVQSKEGLFGGCTSFLPDISSGNLEVIPSSSSVFVIDIPKKYVKYALIAALVAIVVFGLFKWRNKMLDSTK